MSQETRVYQGFAGTRGDDLQRSLAAALPLDADWRPVPHAVFSVRTGDVVVTLYRSGKLVVQGKHLDDFLGRHLPDLLGAQVPIDTLPIGGVTIGSDEAGKGDFFGPLVVAAACVAPAQEEKLRAAGITDSKRLSDVRANTLAGLLEREVPHEFSMLMPVLYNQAWARAGSLNVLLADMHARAMARLRARCSEVEALVVDRFATGDTLDRALARELPDHPPLLQVTRGERHVAVAAASVLARARFLEGLRECSDASGTDLPKGAGEAVDAAARRVLAIGGRELLATVAKMHFKNSQRV